MYKFHSCFDVKFSDCKTNLKEKQANLVTKEDLTRLIETIDNKRRDESKFIDTITENSLLILLKEQLQNKSFLTQKDNKSIPKTDKHVLIVEENKGCFLEENWSTVVKKKVANNLKSVPVQKAILSKKGQGCIFLPTKKVRNEAIAALKNDFKVTTGSLPVLKKMKPKIKIYNLNNHNLEKNEELKKKY